MQHSENIVISDEHDPLQTNEANAVDKAATVIQKHIRRDLMQSKYGIDHLENDELTSYKTFVLGNDPNMSALRQWREPRDKIAIVATSGLRSVFLALKLGNKKNIPKIIQVDNSREVHEFWYAVRALMRDESKAETQALFLENFPLLLNNIKSLYRDDEDVNVIMANFKAWFKGFGYDYVRAIIVHASLIKQSWADPDVFIKIKNILSYQGINKIYMYPSNIASYIDDIAIRNQLFENIEKLNPVVCIHTDLIVKQIQGGTKTIKRPENVMYYLITILPM